MGLKAPLMVRGGSNLVPRALSPGFRGGAPHLQSQEKRPGDEVGLEGNPTVWGTDRECPKDLCMLQYYFWTLQEDSDWLILKSEIVCKYLIVQIYIQKPWDQSCIGEKIFIIPTGTVTELNKT